MWKERYPRPELALLALVSLAAPSWAESVFLDEIPVSASGGLPADAAVSVRVTLHVRDSAAVQQRLPAALRAEVGEGRVSFDLGSHTTTEGGTEPAYLRSSFVVDFEEPEVRDLAAKVGISAGRQPSIDALVRAADAALPRKTKAWGWLVASQAARRGEGDCTEHAVLLTALARLAGLPARVVLGVVLVSTESTVRAFGHAWAEIHDGRHWVAVDATRTDQAQGVRYLRLGALDDEGSGYAAGLMALMQTAWPKRIELRTALQEPPTRDIGRKQGLQ